MYRTARFVPFCGSFIAGIIAGNFLQGYLPLAVACTLFAAVLLSVAVFRHRPIVTSVCAAAVLFGIGFIHINLYLHPLSSKKDIVHHINPSETALLDGVVVEAPRVTPFKTDLIVAARQITRGEKSSAAEGRILLSIYTCRTVFHYGNYIRARIKLKKPENFGNPGAFDYERYLLRRGIAARGSVSNPADIVILREYHGNRFWTCIERFRFSLASAIAQAVPGNEGTVLQALILGISAGIPDAVLDDFNRTGVTHILAISGLNISIVAFLAMWSARITMNSHRYLLLRFSRTRMSSLCSLIVIILYTFIAGCSISTVRATLMIAAFLAALLIGRERTPFNTLACAALVVLMISPASLFDISFQLSFVAVASLIVGMPPLIECIERCMQQPRYAKAYFLKYVLLSLAVNLTATLGTLPIVVYYFNRLSLVSLLANFFIVPLMGFIVIPLGIAFIMLNCIAPAVSVVVIKCAAFVTELSLALAHTFASLPVSSITLITPTLFEITAYYVSLSFLIIASTHARRIASRVSAVGASATLFIVVIVSIISSSYSHDTHPSLEITFIDVGQGSSTLVRFPNGATMLIDGGGFYDRSFDTGRFVVAPFLWHSRIATVDTVVLSHPDEDHLGGLPFILDNFSVREVWSNRDAADSASFISFMNIMHERHIPHHYVCSDSHKRYFGDAAVAIVNPDCRHPASSGGNGDSVVVAITYKGTSALITSDIDEAAEERILRRGTPLRCTVMSAPHHGARTSSSAPFIDDADPDVVIFSCGVNNVFGFPSTETMRRYRRQGARCFRTDIDGAITVIIDNDATSIHTYKTRRNEYVRRPA